METQTSRMRDLILIDSIFRLTLPFITLILLRLLIQSHTKPVKSFAIRFNSNATRLHANLSHFSRDIDFLSLLSVIELELWDLFCQKWAKTRWVSEKRSLLALKIYWRWRVKKYNFWIPQQRWRWDDNNFCFLASDEWNMRCFTVRLAFVLSVCHSQAFH